MNVSQWLVGVEFRWIEALCLAGVILATTWVEVSIEEKEDTLPPVTSLDGQILLSTRSAMDSLNLDLFDIGAKATFDLEVISLEPAKCAECDYELEGRRIMGNVNITELIDDQGRSGRIEAEMVVEHIEERDSNGFLLQEWFHLDWNAGSSSFNQLIHVVHSSPPWLADQVSGSFLVDTSTGQSSRTGPNLFTEQISEGVELVRACLPDSFTCNAVSSWDIEMNVNRGTVGESIVVDAPPENIEISIPEGLDVSESGLIGSWFDLTESDTIAKSSCLQDPGDIVAAGTWNLDGSGSAILSPLSSILSSAGLPVLQIQLDAGTLTVLEGSSVTCSHYSAEDTISQISLIEY